MEDLENVRKSALIVNILSFRLEKLFSNLKIIEYKSKKAVVFVSL